MRPHRCPPDRHEYPVSPRSESAGYQQTPDGHRVDGMWQTFVCRRCGHSTAVAIEFVERTAFGDGNSEGIIRARVGCRANGKTDQACGHRHSTTDLACPVSECGKMLFDPGPILPHGAASS